MISTMLVIPRKGCEGKMVIFIQIPSRQDLTQGHFTVGSYFSRTVLIQTIQFRISIVFVSTQINVKTVLFQTIQIKQIQIETHARPSWKNLDALLIGIPIERRFGCQAMNSMLQSRYCRGGLHPWDQASQMILSVPSTWSAPVKCLS